LGDDERGRSRSCALPKAVLAVSAGGGRPSRNGGPRVLPRKNLGNIWETYVQNCACSCKLVLYFSSKASQWFCAECYKFCGGNFWPTIHLYIYKERT